MEFDIEEAKRICEAATPGPWSPDAGGFSSAGEDSTFSVNGPDSDFFYLRHYADTKFIAYSRTALPAALSEIERLTAALELRTKERDQAVKVTEIRIGRGRDEGELVWSDQGWSNRNFPELTAHLKEVKDAG
jgi:hypothetical protein